MSNIIDIRIDTNDLFEGLYVSKEEVDSYVDSVIKNLTYSYKLQVEKEAQKSLHFTRSIYLQNLKFVDSGRMEGTVLLDYSKNKLVKMIEEGASSFDMKENFLKSSKVKYTKSGKPYLTIPFRFSTPSAIGESDVFQSKMPEEVYKIVKNKPLEIPTVGGSRSQGIKLNELPQEFQVKNTRPEIPGFNSYEHKNSIYEGITKNQDRVTGQNRYGSFRRVSENSDQNSWVHPGLNPKNLFEEALRSFRVEDEISRSMDIIWEQKGFVTS